MLRTGMSMRTRPMSPQGRAVGSSPGASMNAPAPAPSVTISDQQVRHFVDQGFLVMPGLVSPAELELLKQDPLALARGAYPCESLKPVPAGLSDREVIESIL